MVVDNRRPEEYPLDVLVLTYFYVETPISGDSLRKHVARVFAQEHPDWIIERIDVTEEPPE